MQKIPVFLAIGFLLLTAFNLSTTCLSPPTPSNQIGVVSADKMNVLYIGVDNPISVAISDVPIEQTKVTVSDGTISETDKLGTYNVRVTRPGKLTIRAEGITNQGKAVSKELDFRVKRISQSEARVGNKSGGRMSIGAFKAQKGLTIEVPQFHFDTRFHVISFTLSSSNRKGDIEQVFNQGSVFGKPAKEMIQKAEVGDIYYFDNIRARTFGCTARKLPPISFKLY